jgi:hypothetical protein
MPGHVDLLRRLLPVNNRGVALLDVLAGYGLIVVAVVKPSVLEQLQRVSPLVCADLPHVEGLEQRFRFRAMRDMDVVLGQVSRLMQMSILGFTWNISCISHSVLRVTLRLLEPLQLDRFREVELKQSPVRDEVRRHLRTLPLVAVRLAPFVGTWLLPVVPVGSSLLRPPWLHHLKQEGRYYLMHGIPAYTAKQVSYLRCHSFCLQQSMNWVRGFPQ